MGGTDAGNTSDLLDLFVKTGAVEAVNVATYRAAKSGTAAVKDFGISQTFKLENAGGSVPQDAVRVDYVFDDPTNNAEYCRIDFNVMVNGSYKVVATMDRNGTSPVVVSSTEPTDPRTGLLWLNAN